LRGATSAAQADCGVQPCGDQGPGQSARLRFDYEKAPSAIQRFGEAKRLISQTLDPIISAYFRDVAQSSHMLELLTPTGASLNSPKRSGWRNATSRTPKARLVRANLWVVVKSLQPLVPNDSWCSVVTRRLRVASRQVHRRPTVLTQLLTLLLAERVSEGPKAGSGDLGNTRILS
jgi:hypothetical protein